MADPLPETVNTTPASEVARVGSVTPSPGSLAPTVPEGAYLLPTAGVNAYYAVPASGYVIVL